MYSKDSLNEEKKNVLLWWLRTNVKMNMKINLVFTFVTKSTINTNVYMSTDRTNFCKNGCKKIRI
jgi:hypothetical protein